MSGTEDAHTIAFVFFIFFLSFLIFERIQRTFQRDSTRLTYQIAGGYK